MSKLPYLVAEISAALDVYLSGRTGQQYNRTAFILCDDCAELASKLFLLTDSQAWTDIKQNGHFKRFKEVNDEVRAVFQQKRPDDRRTLEALLLRIERRRERRNQFFHSTHLLDLTLHPRDCVDTFCDLLDYGVLLFPGAWEIEVAGTGNMQTCEALIRLDRMTYNDPGLGAKLNNLLAKWPRSGPNPCRKGCQVTHHAEDMHLRLAIRNGGSQLRDKLRALL